MSFVLSGFVDILRFGRGDLQRERMACTFIRLVLTQRACCDSMMGFFICCSPVSHRGVLFFSDRSIGVSDLNYPCRGAGGTPVDGSVGFPPTTFFVLDVPAYPDLVPDLRWAAGSFGRRALVQRRKDWGVSCYVSWVALRAVGVCFCSRGGQQNCFRDVRLVKIVCFCLAGETAGARECMFW
jgi:hypothetical protein